MKRNLLRLILLLLIGCSYSSIAQPGKDCANPYMITSIPFTEAGFTTAGFVNDYTSSICNENNYLLGNDFVFQFIPSADMNIRIELTGIGYGVGAFVLKRCPSDPLSECVAFEIEGSTAMTVNNVNVIKDSVYYIIIDTWNFAGFNPSTTFDINIYEIHPKDVWIKGFNKPFSTCDMDETTPINLDLMNLGSDTASNFQIYYSINGGAPHGENMPIVLVPGDSEFYGFWVQPDMSIPGEIYCVKVWIDFPGDAVQTNDTIERCFKHMGWVNSFPYFESFEIDSGGWFTSNTNSSFSLSSWQCGIPDADTINSASDGNYAWVTNLTGFNNFHEFSYVVSPCFDFSTLVSPIVEFDIWYATAEIDVVNFEYSTDGGQNWDLLGDVGDGWFNWYNTPVTLASKGWNGSSLQWVTAIHGLSELAGVPQVQFRFHLEGSSTEVSEGFAFDNFKIYESPSDDLGVINFDMLGGCGIDLVPVTVSVVNYGLLDKDGFYLAYEINGGTPVSEFFDTLIISQDTLILTFTSLADLSTNGQYNLTAYSQLPGDEESINDTARFSLYNFKSVNEFPYYEDFESGDGGYFTSGLNSSWEWGTPADSVITHAASGSNCWVTNLTGYHSLMENSYLTLPCFDFSTLSDPEINFNIWYETIIMGLQFEISQDEGNTWTTLGHMSDPDWYNSGYAWVGSSGDWINVKHSLTAYAGISTVQIRLKFYEDISSTGVGIDDIMICDTPVAGFEYTPDNFQVAFTDTSNHAFSWHWDFGDGTFSDEQNPVHDYAGADTFKITLVVTNLCGRTDTLKSDIILVSIDDLINSKVRIYPNPVKDVIVISQTAYSENYQIEIFNETGELVWAGTNNQQTEFRLNMEDFAPGLYILKLRFKDGYGLWKVTKQ